MARNKRKAIKLDIGSGGPSGDSSFIGVDAFAEGAEVKAFMWDLPYEDETVDTIYCAQALEHVSKYAVVPTLQEWRRVLKSGGKLQLQVPDLQWAVMNWLANPTTEWNMDIIFGNQRHEGEYHKTGFTMEILAMYFNIVGGFKVHKMEYFGGTLEDAVYGKPNTGVVQRCINLEATKE